MNAFPDNLRSWVDLGALSIIGWAMALVALGVIAKQMISGFRAFHHTYKAAARYVEIESAIHEIGPMLVTIAAQGPVLTAIAAQFERNGGSSLLDRIEANHKDAERHWTELGESSTRAVADLATHLLKLDNEHAEWMQMIAALQGEGIDTKARMVRLEDKLDRWIALITKTEAPEPEAA